MKVTISKDRDWQISSFAKAPLELLLCDDLLPTTKLLWIVLANQANFRPIDRSVLDRRIGIHRSTRLRGMAELREAGFISGTDTHIVVHDPAPILAKLEMEERMSWELARTEVGLGPDPESKENIKKTEREVINYFELAKSSWNNYRPSNYKKIRQMSAAILKAVDLHIKALGIKAHDYENFFSVIKTGVEKSEFWSQVNSNKSLESIVGVGQPSTQKYHNVHNLYNEGLEHGASKPIKEQERTDDLILPSRLRQLIDNYDELHYSYSKLHRNNPAALDTLSSRILEVEQQFRDEKLDPAKFRMNYSFSSWPSDVAPPNKPRKRFWKFDDEV